LRKLAVSGDSIAAFPAGYCRPGYSQLEDPSTVSWPWDVSGLFNVTKVWRIHFVHTYPGTWEINNRHR